MSFSIPPFKPRPPKPLVKHTAAKSKAHRRLKIFPHYRAHLPTSNVACARFRIWRKELDTRTLQLDHLKKMIDTLSATLLATTAEHQRVFALCAHVHGITVSFAPPPEDRRPDSPILISFPIQPLPSLPSEFQDDIHVHQSCIKQVDTLLELTSCTSSPLPSRSTTPTMTASQSESPEPLSFPPLFESAIFHCAPLRKQAHFFTCEAYWDLSHAFRKHRRKCGPGRRPRIRRRKSKH